MSYTSYEQQEINLDFSANLFSVATIGSDPAGTSRDYLELNDFTLGQSWDQAKIKEWLSRRYPGLETSKPSYVAVIWQFMQDIAETHSDKDSWRSR